MDSNIQVQITYSGFQISAMSRKEAEELRDLLDDSSRPELLDELYNALDDVLRNGNS
jgi:hypothetical protein